jgi:hypothetical protein
MNPSTRKDFFMKKKITIVAVIVIILAAGGIYAREITLSHSAAQQQAAIHAAQQKTPTVTYKGENGQNALTLLKQYTSVQQDNSGLVVAINGYKPTGHMYWAFYINGRYSSVGSASYVTKDSDVITWKVEKY